MKAKVDKNLCTGCGLCADTCPEVFQMDDAVAKVICETVPKQAEGTCRDAADNCPVEAIALEE
ncbi:MAG: ferredoxin [Kiritimatiellia bacterium]